MMTNIVRWMQIGEVGHAGIDFVVHTLGYYPTDKQYWLHRAGDNWLATPHRDLDFIQDDLYPDGKHGSSAQRERVIK